MRKLYLLCCAIGMYGVNPGGQKAEGKVAARLAGARGVLSTEWDATVLAPLTNQALACHRRWVEKGEHSTVSNRGTAAKAPLTEHNARELFYGGPRPCRELAIALATGNWLARKSAN